jgi:multiple sugar transport system substrate-binding protein
MKRTWMIVLLCVLLLTTVAFSKTKIVYWQYYYETKIKAIDEVIVEFQRLNPDIEVEHVNFPYENFNQKVAASVPAGVGPDVVNLFYGWIPKYVTSGYLQPLPENEFSGEYLAENFYPFVGPGASYEGKVYVLPIAVRSLALIWNKDLFKAAGLDPEKPPVTLNEMVDYARKMTVLDKGGNTVQAGLTMQPSGQGHQWIREVLIRQFGGVPYSSDNKTVLYDKTGAGSDVLKFYTDMIVKDKISYPGFMNDDVTAFSSQKAAMTIDGSFRIGTLKNVKGLNYAFAELPSHNGVKSNFASFWANGITKNATGEKLTAAIKFVKFLASEYVMEIWLKQVGELPANPKLGAKYYDDPTYGPFLKGLEYAHATFFVDETAQRQVIMDAVDKVINGYTPAAAWKEMAAEEQQILNKFWK